MRAVVTVHETQRANCVRKLLMLTASTRKLPLSNQSPQSQYGKYYITTLSNKINLFYLKIAEVTDGECSSLTGVNVHELNSLQRFLQQDHLNLNYQPTKRYGVKCFI